LSAGTYLKFLFKVHGLSSDLYAKDTFQVLALEEIKKFFPQGTFENYWSANFE
jgi:hypothetical protein